jgi:hypothetical protein
MLGAGFLPDQDAHQKRGSHLSAKEVSDVQESFGCIRLLVLLPGAYQLCLLHQEG